MKGLKRVSTDQSIRTHWGTGANQTELREKTHTVGWNSVSFTDETVFHYTMVSDTHTHTYRHPHKRETMRHLFKKKNADGFLRPRLLPPLLKNLSLPWLRHVLFLHLHDEIPNVRWHHDVLCFPTSSVLEPVAVQPRSPRTCRCIHWKGEPSRLVSYSKTRCCSVVTGEDNGALSAKCVWLSQIAYCRRRRWADTDQAQCLHKHIRRTDRRT